MASAVSRMGYALGQGTRVAWYFSHYLFAARLAGRTVPPDERGAKAGRRTASRDAVMGSLRRLFETDLRNIEAGLYAMPHDLIPDPFALMKGSRRFFRDLPAVRKRRAARENADVPADTQSGFPRYYRQNFHYQSDGYLSDKSAKLYDFQVETLFSGAADAMRRQGLVPISEFVRQRDQRTLNMLDVACGTGRFLSFVKDNFPRLNCVGLDLSPNYLKECARTVKAWRDVTMIQANAEHIPLPDQSQDIVSNVYLFHELPPKVRPTVAAEMARLLKPGGILVFVDSLQYGDTDGLDGLLDVFPDEFHEPYYASYAKQDLTALFEEQGLVKRDETHAFLTKVMVFEKP